MSVYVSQTINLKEKHQQVIRNLCMCIFLQKKRYLVVGMSSFQDIVQFEV